MINNTFKAYEESILKKLGVDYSGLCWCELGNQVYSGKPAKNMYVSKGVVHTSIDINGKLGALSLDLDNPVPKNLCDKFDVVTNYGTTEHVNNQYSVFRNIHSMCKRGGIMLHGVPVVGQWPKHCRYYYSDQFFMALSSLCAYTLVDLRILNAGAYEFPNNLVVCVLRKGSRSFPPAETFLSIKGITDSGDLINTGNYSMPNK